ncbi:MAG: coproporphyrinogen III oxidase [Alphaproteobacteria bacterium]|nr:coproporphyrinogen III oxidase [Alphaproteobacteria bacterium]
MHRKPPLAIYVHWPFCKKKCPYCDFNSHVREQVDHVAWQTALLKELAYWRAQTTGHRVVSIFFGGGTPSLMEPSTIEAIIRSVRDGWECCEDIEITMEANPTSVEAAKFRDVASAGVNRLSLGVQSLKQESLSFLGREHSASEALYALELAAKHFPRYSFDLIYALPHQTLAAWESELRDALKYVRGHLSLYQLTIEENTAFHHAYHVKKEFALPPEPLAASMYETTQTIMNEAGLPAYEVSNHAAAGQASRHNLAYWRAEAYLGIGPGAHGRVDIADNRIATRNLKSPERWLEVTTNNGNGIEEALTLTAQERTEEQVLMGLRLMEEGIDASLVSTAKVAPLIAQQLLQQNGDNIRVTAKGALLLNAIIASLLT